jgi:hypothetical protein
MPTVVIFMVTPLSAQVVGDTATLAGSLNCGWGRPSIAYRGLAVQEQIVADRIRSDGIDVDAPAAQFVGKHMNETFDPGLRGDVGT